MDGVAEASYNPHSFVYQLTAFFGAVGIIGPFLVPRGPDQDLYRVSIAEAALFMWLAWVTIYCSQVNPHEHLTFRKEKLAFISHAWGNAKDIKEIELPTTTTKKRTTTTKKKTTTTTTTTTTTPEPTTTTTTTIPVINTTTTQRKWYYRTYTDAWRDRQYFLSHSLYFDFAVKTAARVTIYLSDTWQKRDRDINVFLWPDAFECREYEVMHRFLQGTYLREKFIQKVEVEDNLDAEEYRRFWIDFRKIKVITAGRHEDVKPVLTCHREKYGPRDAGYVMRYISFASIQGEADWLIYQGVTFEQIGHYGGMRRRMPATASAALRSSTTEVVTSPAYVEAKPNYKFIPIIGEPIEFGVLVERQVYREFFLLLSPTYKRVDSSVLIHIGSNQGRTCTITKNWEVVKMVKCKLEWHQHFYLQFWVYYRNGTIAVKAGYSTPDSYPVFIAWTDPKPSTHKYYGLRTVVGTQIPMSVIEVVHPEEL